MEGVVIWFWTIRCGDGDQTVDVLWRWQVVNVCGPSVFKLFFNGFGASLIGSWWFGYN